MNWTQIEGQWKQIGHHVQTQWDKITDDDLKKVGGKQEQLVGKVQERYGLRREEAERQVSAWSANFTMEQDNGKKPVHAKAPPKHT